MFRMTRLRRWLPDYHFRGQSAPRTRRPFRPFLCVLEDRCVPSTFLVTNFNDAGAGSLRQAVLDANANPGAESIEFAPKLSGTIALSDGQLSITEDLTVVGPGAGVLAVSGNDASRLFEVHRGVTATIL